MPDLLHKLLKTIDYHRYTFIGLLLAAAVIGVATGCQPKAISPFTGEEVTRAELDTQVVIEEAKYKSAILQRKAEVDFAIASLEMVGDTAAPAYAELEREQLALNAALEQVSNFVTTHGGPYANTIVGALGVAGLLLGGGAVADNRRKDGVIRKQKEE